MIAHLHTWGPWWNFFLSISSLFSFSNILFSVDQHYTEPLARLFFWALLGFERPKNKRCYFSVLLDTKYQPWKDNNFWMVLVYPTNNPIEHHKSFLIINHDDFTLHSASRYACFERAGLDLEIPSIANKAIVMSSLSSCAIHTHILPCSYWHAHYPFRIILTGECEPRTEPLSVFTCFPVECNREPGVFGSPLLILPLIVTCK